MIPIVFGNANYSKMAPDKSFINLNDFETIRDFVEYMKYLDNNVTAFAEYLEWKNYFEVDFFAKVFCQLCEALNDDSRPEKTYPDMHKWWFQDSKCQGQKLIPTIRPMFA